MSMLNEKKLLSVIMLSVSAAGFGQTETFVGSINPRLPAVTITTQYEKSRDVDVEMAKTISSIQIHFRNNIVQTIAYKQDDESQPVFHRYPNDHPVELKDVDCDGYKDLLVRLSEGIHGETWYHLYRYEPGKRSFVEYLKFTELPLVSVNYKSKTVKTSVNSGAAGCVYSAATYHWVRGELVPLRDEEQWPGKDDNYTRIITDSTKGKAVVTQRNVSGKDCHIP